MLHAGELQPTIRTEDGFLELAHPREITTLCPGHCSTCVAEGIRGMMTWRHPHLPSTYHRQSAQASNLNGWQLNTRVVFVYTIVYTYIYDLVGWVHYLIKVILRQ